MICVPIFGTGPDEIVAMASEAAYFCNLLELRMDLLKGISAGLLKGIIEAMPLPVIATNRASWEGGNFTGTEEDRVYLLEQAVTLGASYVDVEFATDRLLRERVMEVAEEHGTRVIFSYHDFERTPPFNDLEALFERMVREGADMAKIVTYATSRSDFFEIARLFPLARRLGVDLIGFCMGQKGCYSRLFCLHLGSFLTFASLEQDLASAPGQIPAKNMNDIFDRMESICSGDTSSEQIAYK